MQLKLAGKTALVTGASRGIGRAIALELARHGAAVTLNYSTHQGEASEALREIEAEGGRGLVFQADVADREAVERMVDETVRSFSRIDILVNNAAFSVRKPFLELSVNDVARTWAVSQWGVFHCSQAAARKMVNQGGGGNIVVVSSVHSFRPYPEATAYNAAKAAINQMAATWAVELSAHRIRVNVLEPGWTDTPGERQFYSDAEITERGRELPMGRLATAAEVARAALFLACEDSSYMTGGVLRVDGGFSLTH